MRSLSLLAVMALLVSLPIQGQSTFAGIVGTVKDPSGSIVPRAVIEVLDMGKNTVRTAESNASGLYEVLNLVPGVYRVTVSKGGFATSQVDHITLDARQTVRADFQLKIAATRETVNVTQTITSLNTENATIADTKTSEQITQLPVNYRGKTTSPLSAILTVPGVEQDASGNVSLAGGLPAQVDYSLDGVSTANIRHNGPITDMYPSSEMLGEFRVTEVNNNAEFAQMGDVTVSTKSGSNALHGSGFWYFQNAALDAQVYNAPVKQAKVFNTFGGSLGGPISIPNVYHGKDHTFFFADYEGNREPGSTPLQFSVPTPAMWAGNLDGLPGPPAFDPNTGLPFPNNVVPNNRINPVAAALSAYYPSPNFNSGSTFNNYRELLATPSTDNGYDIRLDQTINSKQQIFGRWSWKNINYSQGSTILPADQYGLRSRNLILSHNFLITPNLLNEFRFGLSRWTLDDHFPLLGATTVSALGLLGGDLQNVPAGTGGFPSFDFSEGTGFATIGHGRDGGTSSSNYEFGDNLSWNKGRHSMKYGLDIRVLGYGDVVHSAPADDFGNLTFTSTAFSGNAFVDLLLGLPSNTLTASEGPNLVQNVTHYNFYAQDAWRVNDRITFSYGLRYEIYPSMTEAHGNITNFNPVNGDVIIPDHGLPANPQFLAAVNACPGNPAYPCTKVITASQAGLPESLRKTYYGNWDPRISIAYRPFRNGKTVIRSGFGVFTETGLGPQAYALSAVATSEELSFTNFQAPGQPPVFTLPQTSGGAYQSTPIGTDNFFTASNINFRDPVSYQWNLTGEHEFRDNTVVRLSYIGSHSVRLLGLEDLNQVHASATPYSHSLVPFPNFADIGAMDNIFSASYNSLDAELTHRQGNGLFYQASYTFSRNIGNAGAATGGGGGANLPGEADFSFITDRFDKSLDRGNMGGTRGQRFLLTALYPLPFGRGHKFGSNNRFTDTLLGGWNLSTIALVETGPWVTPLMSSVYDQSNTNMLGRFIGTARPDRIGSGIPSNRTRNQYFDVNAFTPPPVGCGCFGTSGVGILEGPGTVTIAGGLAKQFRITERLSLRLEGTFTNLLNHPNFQPPDMNISDPGFGVLTSTQTQENAGNRSGQVAARLDF